MSAAVREALAAAVNEVLGDKRCAPYYRSSKRPGDAWVSFARGDLDDTGFDYMDLWEVRIALPQNLDAAERWVDEHRDPIVEALAAHLIVTAVVFVTLVTDAGNVPGLVVEGTREHTTN